MLAARDQENMVFGHQARHLQPKTPGARYPKTPLKVPLRDENATPGFGGKSVLAAKGGNENLMTGRPGKSGKNLVTPLEPQIGRAPLGNKTTNAKARATQTTGVKDIVREIEKTQVQPTTTQRPRIKAPKVESSKLEVLNDENGPLDEEEDIEYCPPKAKDLPFESDLFTEGEITFEGLKPENRLKGYYDFYFNKVDANGMTASEREMQKKKQTAFKKADLEVIKHMDEIKWDLGFDTETLSLPTKKTQPLTAASGSSLNRQKAVKVAPRHPSTIASRQAATALSLGPKLPATGAHGRLTKPNGSARTRVTSNKAPSFLVKGKGARQELVMKTTRDNAAGAAASRSTLGYAKGRSASSVVHGRTKSEASAPSLPRSLSTASSGSDTTITPARYAHKQLKKQEEVLRVGEHDVSKKLDLLSIFDGDGDEDEDDGFLCGSSVIPTDDLDDNFEFNINF